MEFSHPFSLFMVTIYIKLAVEQRENTDLRSIGELFYLGIDELPDLQFTEALHLVLLQFAALLQQNCLLSEQAVQMMLKSFLQELPALWSESLQNVHGFGFCE